MPNKPTQDTDFSSIPAVLNRLSASAEDGPPALISASGAVGAHATGSYYITAAGVAALTLAAPTATTDDGNIVSLVSTTAQAHTLTATGLLKTGSANVNVATFAAFAGASLKLQAYQGLWYVRSSNAITFT